MKRKEREQRSENQSGKYERVRVMLKNYRNAPSWKIDEREEQTPNLRTDA